MFHPVQPFPTTRRDFLKSIGGGFASVAMSAMAAEQAAANMLRDPLSPKPPHFAPKAKRVILLWMQGGPSQMDLFDFKPRLKSEAGNQVPFKLSSSDVRFEKSARLMPPVAEFKQTGQSGMWVSDMMPRLSEKVDELCFLRALQTDSPAHPGAIRLFQSGSLQFVRPSLGSWILYGLGTENQNLPGFVVISPMLYGDDGSTLDFSNVFLPAIYQGTRLGDARTPVKNSKIGYLGDSAASHDLQRRHLDLIQSRNRTDLDSMGGDRNIDGLIQSYELAFRMQMEAPGVFDI